jgi:TetR/AcrR family fatty acid metabolism transcriptional regulator
MARRTKAGNAGSDRLSADVRIAEIVGAARQELADRGYQDFLPSNVARRCGVSEATIYRYFSTKRDLLIKVAEEWLEELLAIEPEIGQDQDIFTRLQLAIQYSLGVVLKHPSLTRFLLQELRPDPEYRSMRAFELNKRFTAHIVTLVNDAIAGGLCRPSISPALVRDLIFGGVEHQAWSYLRGEGGFDAQAAADGIATVILRGISAGPADGAMFAPLVAKLESDADAMRQELGRLRALLNAAPGSSPTSVRTE